jgi:hypothetical protein
MNWDFFKVPIMATIKVTGMMTGIPQINTKFLYFVVVILPFIPIYKYASTFDDEFSIILVFFYFLFYLVSNIFFTKFIKKIGKRWSKEEYDNIKSDQITFPFILVLLLNTLFHFGFFLLISKFFY